MNPVLRSISSCVGLTAVALLASSCNFFSPVGGPGGDTQILSAARACLDRGDYQCATDNYAKLSSADADIANSEGAYTILDQQNAGMTGFTAFIGDMTGSGTPGSAVTKYANRLSTTGTPGQTSRVAIYGAFLKASSVTEPQLKAFVQFTSSLALVAEILAEGTTSAGNLSVNDLATNGTACKIAALATCAANANCSAPSTSNLIDGSGTTLDMTASTTMNGTQPNTDQLIAAIQAATTAINTLQPGGNFSSTISAFNTVIGQLGSNRRCTRMVLLQQGFGN